MGKVKKVVAAALVGALMFSAVGCGMIEKTESAKQGTVVAKVNGEKITLGDVDKELESTYKRMEQQYGENFKEDPKAKEMIVKSREQALDSMVTEKVLIAKAKELKLVPSDEELTKEVNQKFDDLKNKLGENFQAAMDADGFTEETLKDYLKNQIIVEKAVDYAVKDIAISDEDIKSYYEENKEQFKQSAGANMKHILAATEDEAKDIKAKIDAGTSFDKLFEEYKNNKAQGKKPIAEDLGFVAYNEQNFDPAFLEGAKNLKEGEVSAPVKSSFGYHIIQATGIKSEEHIPTLDESKEKIKTILENQKKSETLKNTIETWKKEEKAQVSNDKLNQ
ncbi:peptidylprolyl isomerase [Clostridium tarantellae]|uniref:peptidylprolyl isomerase n=1 Tax=Clostridium tarantellae TaxID=39493 RepID=A0A6I1MJ55_9CLOT|nr:peptidylprolyl isomerase [Clostridium tarantellae]MPQ42172.1 peptidylprolyl isomerase [Clostridium tarantellae]